MLVLYIFAMCCMHTIQIIRAEVKIANTLMQNNIPLSFADQLSPLLRDIFPDSEIARGYAPASTKTICIVNRSPASQI